MSKLQKKKSFGEKKKRKTSNASSEDKAGVSGSPKAAAPAQAVKNKQVASDATVGTGNVFTRAAEFVREVKVELKKVTWPTRKQTTGTTVVVILFVFVVAAFLGLFDLGLSKLVQVVLT